MAKKKAGKQPKAAGRKGGKKAALVAKKVVKKSAPKGAKAIGRAAMRSGRPHRQARIGLSRNGANPPPMHVGGANTFTVYGDSIGVDVPHTTVTLRSTNHTWNRPSNLQAAGRDALRITATCAARVSKRGATNGTDDLTVTIDLGGTPETECTFDGVEFDA